MTRNSHRIAATEMNSGTVTKNPAMKLRRSHCMTSLDPAGHGQRRASSTAPAAMRYQANGHEADRRTTARNGLHDRPPRRRRRSTNPMAISSTRRGAEAAAARRAGRARTPPSSSASREKTRTPPPPRDRARAAIAADDRRARARHAGDQRQHLARADAERAQSGVWSGVHDGRRGTRPLDDQHDDAADDERRRR